jgi:hypothetical protein
MFRRIDRGLHHQSTKGDRHVWAFWSILTIFFTTSSLWTGVKTGMHLCEQGEKQGCTYADLCQQGWNQGCASVNRDENMHLVNRDENRDAPPRLVRRAHPQHRSCRRSWGGTGNTFLVQCREMLKTGSSPKWRAVILHSCLNWISNPG